ncbi:L-rhamnose 1-dehydrogenase (NADP(+)) [uncultured archaeon]|nr:L-rhamnose 1-dehydrogenase (NADP(+)) [uncultured archaeon]
MKIEGNTVLITGGATGIGFALAKAFVENGNEVIICGRRKDKLKEAKNNLPKLNTIECDISKEYSREMLYKEITSNFNDTNILINNAGIHKIIDFKKGMVDLFTSSEDEIDINLKAPIYLASYFIPNFMNKNESAIINVSSGLAFVPLASMPIYCATKAALHSWSVSLRYQLKDTSIKIFEVMPPIVDTDFHKEDRDKIKNRSLPPTAVAEETLKALEKDEYEIPIGVAKSLRFVNTDNFEQIFQERNKQQ